MDYNVLVKLYEKKLLSIQNKIAKDIEKTFLEINNKVIQTTIIFRNSADYKKNKLFRVSINETKKQALEHLNNLTLENLEKVRNLSINKDYIFFNDLLKKYTEKDYIKDILNNNKLNINLTKISPKIYKYTDNYFKQIEIILNSGITKGLSTDNIAKYLKLYLNKPFTIDLEELELLNISNIQKNILKNKIIRYKPGQGIYRSAQKNLQRLVQSEVNRSYRLQDSLTAKTLPFVKGIKVNLSGQHPRQDICDDLKGNYPKDFKFSGWHPRCICYTTYILASETEIKNLYLNNKNTINYINKIPENQKNYIIDNKDKLDKLFWLKDNEHLI